MGVLINIHTEADRRGGNKEEGGITAVWLVSTSGRGLVLIIRRRNACRLHAPGTAGIRKPRVI